MADQAVGELIRAQNIGATDLFVLEQSGVAKSLAGQVLLNWLTAAADGHGGINKIEKLRSSGLVDTYRITLADTTTFDFTVNNGKSITGISKTGTQGLVDTYTITYNDDQSTTFKVTNGAKGDKGDNAYTWIKYASQKPTESSHSMGDVPDNWIGVYTGNKSSAPSDWKEYKWFQWKGNTGNTGDPARLVSQEVKYQVGDSGSIIPSGNWQSNVPVTPQGKYLWVRTTLTFNSGSPVVSYAVSRQGLDGSGSVSSVAGISPDPQGNVPLSAADVGALATAGGEMTGPIEMNGQPISGLNPPKTETEPVTKGDGDARYLQKGQVANNFTTTEPGFVADARLVREIMVQYLTPRVVSVSADSGYVTTNELSLTAIGKLLLPANFIVVTKTVPKWTPFITLGENIEASYNGVAIHAFNGTTYPIVANRDKIENGSMELESGTYFIVF